MPVGSSVISTNQRKNDWRRQIVIELAVLCILLLFVIAQSLVIYAPMRDLTFGPEQSVYTERWRGFYGQESFRDRPGSYRWTNGNARIELPNPGGSPHITILLAGGPARPVTATTNLGDHDIQFAVAPTPRLFSFLLPKESTAGISLRLSTPTIAEPGSSRELGLVVGRLQVRGGGAPPINYQLVVISLAALIYGVSRLPLVGRHQPATAAIIAASAITVVALWQYWMGWQYSSFTTLLFVVGAWTISSIGVIAIRHIPALNTTPQHSGLKKRIGIGLLGGAVGINILLMMRGGFLDESDKLAAGLLMARGAVLYRDIFAHHFPFSYYWSMLISLIGGGAPEIQRLAVAIYTALGFTALAYITRAPLTSGIAAIIWSLIGPLYFANQVIYQTFSGIAVLVVFGLALVAALGDEHARDGRRQWLAGGYAAVALLANPLTIYPLIIAFSCLIIALRDIRVLPRIGLPLLIGGAAFGASLLFTGSMADFIADVLVFNRDIYSKYSNTDPNRLMILFTQIGSLLGIGNASWLTIASPTLPRPSQILNDLPHWFFSGFLLRCAICGMALLLLLDRRYLAALLSYLFGASLLLRNDEIFHLLGFALFGSFTTTALLSGWLTQARSSLAPESLRQRLRVRAAIIIQASVALMLAVFLIQAARIAIDPRSTPYQTDIRTVAPLGQQLKARACGVDAALGVYPGEPLLHYFSGMRPVSRYIYVWPWVADVGREELQYALRTTPAVVVFDENANVWGIPAHIYLADIQQLLEEEYIYRDGVYLSPDIAAHCDAAR